MWSTQWLEQAVRTKTLRKRNELHTFFLVEEWLKFPNVSRTFPALKPKVLHPGTSLVPGNPDSWPPDLLVLCRKLSWKKNLNSSSRTSEWWALFHLRELRQGATWCYRGHWKKTRPLFSLCKRSQCKHSHCVNRKRLTSEQPVNKWEVICPTGKFLAWPFHPKFSLHFFQNSASAKFDYCPLLWTLSFNFPKLHSHPKYCLAFKFHFFSIKQ